MRKKLAVDAKLLATQTRQRDGVLKEQEKIRATEAAKKQVNAVRLKPPPPSVDTSAKGTLPDPNYTKKVDPEILLEAGEPTKKRNHPRGRRCRSIIGLHALGRRGGRQHQQKQYTQELRGQWGRDHTNRRGPRCLYNPSLQNKRTPTTSKPQQRKRTRPENGPRPSTSSKCDL